MVKVSAVLTCKMNWYRQLCSQVAEETSSWDLPRTDWQTLRNAHEQNAKIWWWNGSQVIIEEGGKNHPPEIAQNHIRGRYDPITNIVIVYGAGFSRFPQAMLSQLAQKFPTAEIKRY